MKVSIFIKGRRDPVVYEGERIDIMDFNLENIEYKQIRCFKKGRSQSELILSDLIIKIKSNE